MLKFNSKQNQKKSNRFLQIEIDGKQEVLEILDFESNKTFISIMLAKNLDKLQKFAEDIGSKLPNNPDESDIQNSIVKRIKEISHDANKLTNFITDSFVKLDESFLIDKIAIFENLKKEIFISNIKSLTKGFDVSKIQNFSEEDLIELFSEIIRVSRLEEQTITDSKTVNDTKKKTSSLVVVS